MMDTPINPIKLQANTFNGVLTLKKNNSKGTKSAEVFINKIAIEMKAKINEHNNYIANIAKNLGVQGKKASFGTSREDKFNIQNDNGYVGSFLTTLGFAPTKLNSDQAFVEINLEQLVMEKPEYLFIAHYRDESIARKWEAEPLWKAIPAVKANHVYSVDADMWARGRGLEASKIMAKQIEGFVKQK
jgi:ferric citrate transport system substrate-binding protein